MPALPFELRNPEIIVKKKAKTDAKFGHEPDKRPIDQILTYGIVNLNKPAGPSSHQVSAYLQSILKLEKAGHSGTLDPMVTGVLPTALGRATRIVQALLTAGKEYVALMHIHDDVPQGKIYSVIKEFTGKIKQLPPVRSAVKRQLREREIYYIDVIEVDGRDVLFKMGCQAGTYVRKWCHDVGEKLGVGAHMAELVRTKAGPFQFNTMVTLQDIEDALHYYHADKNEKLLRHCIQPVENGIRHLSKIWVTDSAVESLCHGALLHVPGIVKFESDLEADETVALLSLKGELIALGVSRIGAEELRLKEKGVAAKVIAVFMQPGTYPRMQRET
ncbi:RNA-guided pseudouridylation complex pseudouridine synthase subunit Cbf5 [Candidatus Woesearchaeota archaeon]|nr:RNA-guided pseudouridylation complex pseudouridine synthase subunit Cbf5 [Candidatus Woesearchaeota archaeon]